MAEKKVNIMQTKKYTIIGAEISEYCQHRLYLIVRNKHWHIVKNYLDMVM